MNKHSIDPTVMPAYDASSLDHNDNTDSTAKFLLSPPPTVSKSNIDTLDVNRFSPVSPSPLAHNSKYIFNPANFNKTLQQSAQSRPAEDHNQHKFVEEALFLPKSQEDDDSDNESVVLIEEKSTFIPRNADNNQMSKELVIRNPSVKVGHEQDTSNLEHFNLAADRQALQPHVRDDFSDGEDDVEYRGNSKRIRPSGSTISSSRDGATPLRALSVEDDEDEVSPSNMVCQHCGGRDLQQAGPSGGDVGVRRGQGKGSTTLSPRVRGNILALLLGGTSLFQRLKGGRVRDWADIAEMVGARREDFDRVRHAAAGLQQDLPNKMRRGQI